MTRHFTRKKVKWLRTASLFIKLDRLKQDTFSLPLKMTKKKQKGKQNFQQQWRFCETEQFIYCWPEFNWYLTDITILENNLSIGTNSFINTQAIGTIILKLSCTKEANSSESLATSLFRQFTGSDDHVGKFLWSWSKSSVPSPPTTLHWPEIRKYGHH